MTGNFTVDIKKMCLEIIPKRSIQIPVMDKEKHTTQYKSILNKCNDDHLYNCCVYSVLCSFKNQNPQVWQMSIFQRAYLFFTQ